MLLPHGKLPKHITEETEAAQPAGKHTNNTCLENIVF